MRTILFLLPLLALSTGLALRDPEIDQYIKDILELLKSMMGAGLPDMGIPPLDPLAIPHFDIPHIDTSDPIPIKLDITIDDLVITNLSTFETKVAHLDLEALSLELNLGIADLRGDATYTLDGKVLGIFPVYGEGPMYLEIYGLDLFAKAAVLINAEGFVVVTEMDITAAFTEIKMHLDGLLGEGNLGETINNILNLLGPMIWDLVKEFLFPLIDDVLMKVLNDALSGCNIADLIQNGSCFQERLAAVMSGRGNDTPRLPLYAGF